MPRLLSSMLFLLVSFNLFAKHDVIAHRGASGYLPEHTLEALILAHAQNADYIEQDLVLSKDLIPVVLHDIHLETVTNVEQVFPKRARDDGRFYAFDFTLAELKTLRVHERTDSNGQQVYPSRYNGQSKFRIATFEEQIQLISELNRQLNREVGYYPEIKSPQWHKKHGADISKIVLDILRKYKLDDANAKIFVQCFDFNETKRMRNGLNAKVKLVQLIGENDWGESNSDYDYLKTPAGLKDIATVAQGIGPWIPHVLEPDSMTSTGLVESAHQLGLSVHPYTFRTDQLPKGITSKKLLDVLFDDIKVDGIFTDFTDTVVHHLQK